MRKKNPEDFWNTVNTFLKRTKGDTSQDVSPDSWIQHFKSLLNMDYANNFPRNDIFNCFGLNNTILNGSIIADEIRKSINSLNKKKMNVKHHVRMQRVPTITETKFDQSFYSLSFSLSNRSTVAIPFYCRYLYLKGL